MKKLILKLTLLLLVLAGIASSCNPEPEKEYPIELSFTEYSLPETSCQWINLPYDEKVLIINSKTELEKYISCTESTYPAIDFAKNTLLLVSGISNIGLSYNTAEKLMQVNPKNYEWTVELGLDMLDIVTLWNVAIIIEKIDKDFFVELKIDLKEITIEYPIEIPLEEYSLADTSCQWTSFEARKVIVINSDEELQNYIECPNGSYPQIDFLRHSLLLVNAIAPSAPAEVISTQLLMTSDNEYSLNLVIKSGLLGTPGPWLLSIIVPKLTQNAILTLTTIYKPIWE